MAHANFNFIKTKTSFDEDAGNHKGADSEIIARFQLSVGRLDFKRSKVRVITAKNNNK